MYRAGYEQTILLLLQHLLGSIITIASKVKFKVNNVN